MYPFSALETGFMTVEVVVVVLIEPPTPPLPPLFKFVDIAALDEETYGVIANE
jgi:hypothetical protein